MFHLFNKVYVQTDNYMDPTQDQINISTDTGYMKLYQDMPGQFGAQLGYAMDLGEYSPIMFRELMQKALEHEGKLFIYVDGATYIRLYGLLIRSLFPSISFETYKHFFLCKKAAYDLARVNVFDSRRDAAPATIIHWETIEESFQLEEPLEVPLRELLMEYNEELSLEWRVFKLLNGEIGNLPATLEMLLKRNVICMAQDTLSEWGRLVTDESTWEFSGCTERTVFKAGTIFEACRNFTYLANPLIHSPGALKCEVTREWLYVVAGQSAAVLEKLEETTLAKRARALEALVDPQASITSVADCIRVLRALFDAGELTIRTPRADAAKYDENLIRWVLRQKVDTIKNLLEEALW